MGVDRLAERALDNRRILDLGVQIGGAGADPQALYGPNRQVKFGAQYPRFGHIDEIGQVAEGRDEHRPLSLLVAVVVVEDRAGDVGGPVQKGRLEATFVGDDRFLLDRLELQVADRWQSSEIAGFVALGHVEVDQGVGEGLPVHPSPPGDVVLVKGGLVLARRARRQEGDAEVRRRQGQAEHLAEPGRGSVVG